MVEAAHITDNFETGIANDLNTDLATAVTGKTADFEPAAWPWANMALGVMFVGHENHLFAPDGVSTSTSTPWRRYRADVDLVVPEFPFLNNMAVQVSWLERANQSTGNVHGEAMLLNRVINQNNFIAGSISAVDGTVRIFRREDGVNTTLAVDTIALPIASPATVRLDCTTGHICLFLNDAEVLSVVTAENNNARRVGIAISPPTSDNNPARYDDFTAGVIFECGDPIGASPSTLAENNLTRQRMLDRLRLQAFRGCAPMSHILTAPQGVTDVVPIARKHLIGR
jgi:hypothetical protein